MKSKEDYWERLFTGYERSGLSQDDFCHEQGIPIEKFKYQWRKKFGSRSNKPKSQASFDKPIRFEPVLISNKDAVLQEPACHRPRLMLHPPATRSDPLRVNFFILFVTLLVKFWY